MNTKQIDVSIGNILNSDHNNAELWRSILRYSIKIVPSLGSQFDVTTLGNWLLNNHIPFRKEYENSHIRMSYRLQSKRTTIKLRIEELVKLTLIRTVGPIKSKKSPLPTTSYEFTQNGHYVAWLIEVIHRQDKKEKLAANLKIFEILERHFGEDHSAVSIAFTHFLRKCRNKLEKDNLLMQRIGFVQNMLPCSVRKFTNQNHMFFAIVSDNAVAKVFLEAINELDEETRKLVFFQIKSDVESSISASLDVNREWEITRYNDISYHNKITTIQFCEECDNPISFKVDMIDFLKSTIDLSIEGVAPTSNFKFYCKKCGRINTVTLYIQFYSSWVLGGAGENIEQIGTWHTNKLGS